MFSFAPAPKAPSFDFLDELKQKLEKRQTEINEQDEAVYKEFDSKLNKFVEISKKERDQKEVKHKQAIQKIEQEETKKRREIQKIQNSINNRPANAVNPLIFEMMQNKAQESDSCDEIYTWLITLIYNLKLNLTN